MPPWCALAAAKALRIAALSSARPLPIAPKSRTLKTALSGMTESIGTEWTLQAQSANVKNAGRRKLRKRIDPLKGFDGARACNRHLNQERVIGVSAPSLGLVQTNRL